QIGEAGGGGGDHGAAGGPARGGGGTGVEVPAHALRAHVIGDGGVEDHVGGGSGIRVGDRVGDVDGNRAGADDGKRDGLEGSWSGDGGRGDHDHRICRNGGRRGVGQGGVGAGKGASADDIPGDARVGLVVTDGRGQRDHLIGGG